MCYAMSQAVTLVILHTHSYMHVHMICHYLRTPSYHTQQHRRARLHRQPKTGLCLTIASGSRFPWYMICLLRTRGRDPRGSPGGADWRAGRDAEVSGHSQPDACPPEVTLLGAREWHPFPESGSPPWPRGAAGQTLCTLHKAFRSLPRS